MEGRGRIIGSRQSDLEMSFKLDIHSFLTSCSKEEFSKAFSSFSSFKKDCLYRLFIQVTTSLHQNIQDGFESLCLETQVRAALDTVEQLVEEQSLNPLFSDKTNVMDVAFDLSTAKKNEIRYLTRMLARGQFVDRILLNSCKSQDSYGFMLIIFLFFFTVLGILIVATILLFFKIPLFP